MSKNNSIFSFKNYKNIRENMIGRGKEVITECDKYHILEIRYLFWLVSLYCYFKTNNEFNLGKFLFALCIPEVFIIYCMARHRQAIAPFK